MPFPQGFVCYVDRPTARLRLTAIAQQLYRLLGFRFGRFSTTTDDCLQPNAVLWVNRALAEKPDQIPTERRPLIEDEEGEEPN